jgi:hypothetical protein
MNINYLLDLVELVTYTAKVIHCMFEVIPVRRFSAVINIFSVLCLMTLKSLWIMWSSGQDVRPRIEESRVQVTVTP